MGFLDTVYADFKDRILYVEDTEITIPDLVTTGRALEAGPENADDVRLLDAEGNAELLGGVKTSVTATLQSNAKLAFKPPGHSTAKQSGTVTTPDATGQVLTDTAALFQTNGVANGALVVNLTDGSVATVLEVLDEQNLRVDQLEDGSDNQFDSADAYKVWNVVQCNVGSGNLVAIDGVGVGNSVAAIHPTAFTQVVLAAASSGTALTEISTAVWDVNMVSHTTAGTSGRAQLLSHYNDGARVAVHFDAINGTAGTALGFNGTPDNPSNSSADTLTIAQALQVTAVAVRGGWYTFSEDHEQWYFFGGEGGGGVDPNGYSAVGAKFEQVQVWGDVAEGYGFDLFIIDCDVEILAGGSGTFNRCAFVDWFSVASDGGFVMTDCTNWRMSNRPMVLDFPDATDHPAGRIFRFSGAMKVTNMTHAGDELTITGDGMDLDIDASCTAGLITLYGDIELSGVGGGVTVVDMRACVRTADCVFDEAAADHTAAGSVGLLLMDLYRVLGLDVVGGPLVVSPTSRTAPGITQTVETVGDTVTVSRT